MNTKAHTGASADAIQHHYDVSNAFYKMWLDPNMIYSSALFLGNDDLETAQINKLNWHLDQAEIAGKQRLLDIGCGWGSLMRRAKSHYNVEQVEGLTLSEAQLEHVQSLGVEGINAYLQSWQEFKPSAPYDGIISIGAFEHFARLDQSQEDKLAGYKAFFQYCSDNLVAGGKLSLQTITYENTSRADFSDFFATEIFPESDLPHLTEILETSKGIFEIELIRNDRHHYADTLRAWHKNLRKNKEAALALVGEEKVATFEKYLALMVVAFHTGSMNLARLSMRKLG